MGEIADMIINGSMCQHCGECFDDEPGYPRSCPSCEGDALFNPQADKPSKISCPECGKKVRESGLNQHIVAKHSEENPEQEEYNSDEKLNRRTK